MPQTNATIDFICIIKQSIEKKIIKKKKWSRYMVQLIHSLWLGSNRFKG